MSFPWCSRREGRAGYHSEAQRERIVLHPDCEFYGYLVSEYHMYECMDVSPETIQGEQSNQDGVLFFHVEPRCGSLPCPPYENTREMTCAVCSK